MTKTLMDWAMTSTPEHPVSEERMRERRAFLESVEGLSPEEAKAALWARVAQLKDLGGPGSGYHGHEGRPGQVGGSAPASGSGGVAEFRQLKKRWAETNDALLLRLDAPESPEVKALVAEQKAIVKRMYELDVDTGGIEGLGMPGGPRDLAIVGAGPGGLAAGVMGGTDGLDTLIIDAQDRVGGQAKFSSRIENYPGFPIGASGEDLAESLHEQAERVGAETLLGVRVTGLTHDPATGIKTLTLSNGETVEARAVVLAGGVEFRRLDFPGNQSPDVIIADAKELATRGAGRSVVVVGGSNGAAQAALGAARTANEVNIVTRSGIAKGMSDYQVSAIANHPRIRVFEGETLSELRLTPEGRAKTAVLSSGTEVDCAAVGIFAGGRPNVSWLPPEVYQDGRVKVNADLETSIPGVFAVGDMRHGGIGRIGAAVGDGQFAERSAFQYFQRQKKQATL